MMPMKNALIIVAAVLSFRCACADAQPLKATDWTSLGPRLNEAWLHAKRENPRVGGGVIWAPLVSVDRTNGNLFAFPQGGALWVSKDRGQSFEWLNHDVLAWGFNESPTNLYISPEGQKIFEDKFRFATSTKNYGFKRWYPEKGLTIEQYEKAEDHWKKLLRDLSRR